MKKLILIAALLIPLLSKAQKLTEYKASNGVVYHVKDTVKLGKGSATDGSFLYLEDRGLPSPHGSHSLPKDFANGGVVIKNIKKVSMNGTQKALFIVDAGGIFNFSLFIDDAILACEVVPCEKVSQKQVSSVADEIKKLKALLDSGAITKAEYDAQKKKLLGE